MPRRIWDNPFGDKPRKPVRRATRPPVDTNELKVIVFSLFASCLIIGALRVFGS